MDVAYDDDSSSIHRTLLVFPFTMLDMVVYTAQSFLKYTEGLVGLEVLHVRPLAQDGAR